MDNHDYPLQLVKSTYKRIAHPVDRAPTLVKLSKHVSFVLDACQTRHSGLIPKGRVGGFAGRLNGVDQVLQRLLSANTHQRG